MADELMNDKQLEVVRQEIAIPFQAHPAGPVAQLAQHNAWTSLNYLVKHYQELRAEVERLRHAIRSELNWRELAVNQIAEQQVEIAAMRPIVEAVAKWGIGGGMPVEFYYQALAYDAQHPATTTGEQ